VQAVWQDECGFIACFGCKNETKSGLTRNPCIAAPSLRLPPPVLQKSERVRGKLQTVLSKSTQTTSLRQHRQRHQRSRQWPIPLTCSPAAAKPRVQGLCSESSSSASSPVLQLPVASSPLFVSRNTRQPQRTSLAIVSSTAGFQLGINCEKLGRTSANSSHYRF